MATIIVRQDGTGDYTTLAAAVAAADANDTIEIHGAWTIDDTAPISIGVSGLTITTVGAARHPGYIPAVPTHYRLAPAVTDTVAILGSDNVAHNTVIDGLVIHQGVEAVAVNLKRCNNCVVKNCIIGAAGSYINAYGIYCEPSAHGTTFTVENCIIFNHSSGIYLNAVGYDSIEHHVNSCSVFGCYNGITCRNNTSTSNPKYEYRVFNTISVGNTAPDYVISGTSTPNYSYRYLTNCIDSDGTIETFATEGQAVECLSNRTPTDDPDPGAGYWVVFEDITSVVRDLRLKVSAANNALDAHYNASGAGLSVPPTDIVGTARPQNGAYDIGAFEIPGDGAVVDVGDAVHAHSADAVSLVQHQVMSVESVSHLQFVSPASFIQHHLLSVESALHNHSADIVYLGIPPPPPVQLVVHGAFHLHSADTLALTRHNILTVQDSVHAHHADLVNLLFRPAPVAIGVESAFHLHFADPVALTRRFAVVVAGSRHDQSADPVVLLQHHVLQVADAFHLHFADSVVINLPVGRVRVLFVARRPDAVFEARQPLITFIARELK